MMAGLIAFATDIYLKGLEATAVQGLAMGGELLFEEVHGFKLLGAQLRDA